MVGLDVALGIHVRAAGHLLITESHIAQEQVSGLVTTSRPVRALDVTVVHRLGAMNSPVDAVTIHRASMDDPRRTNEKSLSGNTNHVGSTSTVPARQHIGLVVEILQSLGHIGTALD